MIVKMKRIIINCCVLIILFGILTGTAYADGLIDGLEKYVPDNYGVIYGHIDTSSVDYRLVQIKMLRYPFRAEPFIGPYNDIENSIIEDKPGFFWAFVKPGDYFLNEFKTKQPGFLGYGNTLVTQVPRGEANVKLGLRSAKPGGLTYWGNVKFIRTKNPGLFSLGSFDVQPIGTSNEIEMLIHLLEAAKGTKWEGIVADRLKMIQNEEPVKNAENQETQAKTVN